jgi:hypothetical protein
LPLYQGDPLQSRLSKYPEVSRLKPYRRSIAFIAAHLSMQTWPTEVMDLISHESSTFEGELSRSRVFLVGYPHQTLFTGTGSDGTLSIHDHSTRTFFTLQVSGREFSGFNYDTHTYFFGTLDQNFIHIEEEEYGSQTVHALRVVGENSNQAQALQEA